MSKGSNYPIDIIQRRLARHIKDLDGSGDMEWLARVIDLCRQEAATIPPPVEEVEAVPEYVYPH